MEVAVLNSLEQGLLTAFMALGVLLTFRMMGFPDLTVEGSFPLGAAVVARMLSNGSDPFTAVLVCSLAGAAAGLVSGIMHTKLKINGILAGILTATAIYSVMLRVMGRPNTPLLSVENLFFRVLEPFGAAPSSIGTILVGGVLVLSISGLLFLFLRTDIGVAVRATGDNEAMIRGLGVNTDTTKMLAMSISNALVALSGGLVAQNQGFADVGMGIGALVAAVASIILGETLIGNRSTGIWIVAVVAGSIMYRGLLNVTLRLGMPPTDLALMTSLLVLVALAYPPARDAWRTRRLRIRRWRTHAERQSGKDADADDEVTVGD